MNENESEISEVLRYWIWSGFYGEDEVQEMLDDLLEEEAEEGMQADEDTLRDYISEEFERKADAEADWPEVTDCDRLDAVFAAMEDEGICALQNAGNTLSDGLSDVAQALHERGPEHYYGYCFYHGQDLERAIDGNGLTLAFGDLDDNPVKMVRVGEAVVAALQAAGFETVWDGTADKRIDIPKIDWKRRG
ncbi:MAG TPA: hypothetical protein VGN52_07800 [Burkholderiales bacterium]|jgi:hypothetical protein